MDNEVVNDLFKRAVSLGYKKDLNSFVLLLHNDTDVLNDSYNYVKSKGYQKSQDDFSLLVGLKKKDQPVVSQTGGYGSQLGSQTFQPTNQPAVLTEKGKKEAEKAELDQIRSQNIADKFKVNVELPKTKLGFKQAEVKTPSLELPKETKVYRDFNAPTIQKEFGVTIPEVKSNIGESITKQGGFSSDIANEMQKMGTDPTTALEDWDYILGGAKRGAITGLKGAVTLAEVVARNPLRLSPAYWATKYIDEDLTNGVDGFFSNLSKKTQPYFNTTRNFIEEAAYMPTGTPGAPLIYEPKEVRELKNRRVQQDKSFGSEAASMIGGALEYSVPSMVPGGFLLHDAEAARENLEQIQKANPKLKLNDNQKDAWAVANGALGELIFGQHGAAKLLNIEGLTKNLKDKILNNLTIDALSKIARTSERLTPKTINKYLTVTVDDFSKRLSLYGLDAIKKVAVPVRDLTILETSKIAGERLVDAYRKNLGKTEEEQAPIFDNTLESDLSRIGQSAGTGAIFGLGGVGIGMATGQMPRLLRTDIINNNIADAIINYPDKADAIKAKMVEELRNKGISDDMIANTMADVDKAVSIASKLPADFPRKYRQKAVEILFDIDDLKELKKINEQKIIAAPDELKANYANETELINARIESKVDELRALHLGQEVKFSEEDGKYYKQIGNGPKEEITETRYLVDNPDKLEENAVQEQSTAGEVPPVTEGGENLQEGGEGVGQGIERTEAPQEIIPEEKVTVTETVQPKSEEQATIHRETGGSTFTVDGVNRNGTKAASVSIFPERTKIVEGELTKEDIDGYVKENSDIYSGNEDVLAVGTWLDGKTGKTYLDVSVVLPKRRATILGKDYNQISVWDLEKGKEILTGGTGEAVEGLKPELDRVKDIRRILGSQRGLKQAEVKKAETKPVVEETVDLASKIRGLKINTGKGRLQSNIAGLPIALYNSVVEAVALSVEAGSTIAEAIDKAIKRYNLDKVDGFNKSELTKNIQDSAKPKRTKSVKDIDVNKIRTQNRPGKRVSKGLIVKTINKEKVIQESDDLSTEYVKENAPKAFINNANILAKYPIVAGIKKFGEIKTIEEAQQVYDIFIRQAADNLKNLTNEYNPELRDIATLWYDGANMLANKLSNEYGISPEQAAGIIAAMSPQKDWYMNVRLGELVMMAYKQDAVLTNDMIAKQIEIAEIGEEPFLKDIADAKKALQKNRTKENIEKSVKAQEKYNKNKEKAAKVIEWLKKYVGQDIKSAPEEVQPYIIRLHNEVNNPREYNVLRPDGEIVEVAKKNSGENRKIAWGSYSEIGKAAAIHNDGSQENITKSLGEMHKIRNFYNNIIDPMSKDGDVTIDTHAVAAALMLPLSGKTKQVGENFGTGTSNSGTLGIKGLYYAYLDAYHLAAKELGLLPRQVQSITWEAVRGLFTDTFKKDVAKVKEINDIWKNYEDGKITIEETRRAVDEAAGGVKDPTWAKSVLPESEGGVERGPVEGGPGVSGPNIVREPSTVRVAANALRKLKIDLGKGTAQSNIAGLPIALYNAAIETIALGLEAGDSLTDAIKNAIEKHKLLDKKKFDSNAFITDIENTTGQKFEGPKRVSGIRVSMVPKDIKAKANQVYQYDTMSDKEILETGRDLVESGAINVVSVVDEIAMNDEPRALQPNEVVAAIWYKADLDTKYEALLTERNEKFAKGEDVSSLDTQIATTQTSLDLYNKMAAITGRQQSLAFRLRKGLVDQDYNVQTRIEMYKKTNNGYIEPKLEQKFKDMAKELDATKAEISRLEKEIASKEEELAIKNITENTKAQSRKINKSALSAAEQARKKQLAAKFRTFNDITRMATLLVDKEFLEYAKLILKEASGEFSQFAKEIVDNVGKDIKDYLPELYKKVGGKGEADVSKLTGKALPKPSVDENGAIVIPSAFIKDLVKSGLTNIKDITEAVKAELIEALPDITSREVRDAITKYGKELKQTKDEITTQINTAKRIGRLYSKLEDLKAGRAKAKTPKQLNDISREEANLRKQIKELGVKVSLPKGKKTLTDEQRVANRIKYLEKYIAEKQRRITEGDFSPKEKPKPLPQTQELIEAQARANRIRNEYDVAQYANEQANRSPFQKTYDFIIELTSGLSKSLKAGLDLSAFLGQGIIYFASTNPRTSIKTVAEAFKGAWSPEYEKKYMDKLKSSPTYYVMEGSGLRIQTPLTTFANVDVEKSTLAILTRLWNTLVSPLKYVNPKAYELAERFSPFAVTERAYTMTVNDMRVRMFVEFENSLMQDGKTFETDPNSFKIAANAVNNMTLSGRLRALEPLAKELNILFFSSRKVTAVLSLANPAYFVDVYRKDRVVGKKLLLKMATFVSMATAASVISNAFSDDDDSGNNPDIANPYSSDFMKIRVGSTRIDPFHGHLAPLILFARFITGNYKSTSSWEQKKLGQDQFTPTRLGLLTRYFGSKLSPSIVQAVKALDESAGNEVEWEDEAVNALKPIWTEDISELKESHPAVMGNFLSFLSYIGMSGSTFGAPFFLDPNNKEDEKLYKLINYQNASFNLKSKSNIKILDGQTLEDRGMTAEEYEVYKKVYGDFIKSELLASYDDFRTMEHLTFEDKLKQIKSKANTLAKEKVSGLSEGIEKVAVKIGEDQVEYKLNKDEVDYRKSLNETYISKHSGLYRKYFKEASKAGYNDIDADYIANRKLQQEANAYSKEKILKDHKQGKYYDFE